ncbi:3-hydroxyacyl-CoA dehydrogenase family protein [Stieleria sp. ICT_E10.1]|uniref:3-hydroxyacyl-CoA dehydrogenase family protein n=1 Tax=Stieleria sedimenti TaxID=2976331 RepID=UPI00217FA716|nr:3-hydroxyacyl-CoA dehydrogenase family protein [Stieleria sedimenti]MCS7470345.1 3-hydroxyacyl-CoA dehydrogenase family protein [Stieleria sedimenti]
MKPDSPQWPHDLPRVLLIGAGVVGRAIADAHAVRNVAFCLADQSAEAIRAAAIAFDEAGLARRESSLPGGSLHAITIGEPKSSDATHAPIVIESIVERCEAKQDLFEMLQSELGKTAVLCSNTSTLLIDEIAGQRLRSAGRVCGMHFFMPVHARAAVEVVAGKRSDDDAIQAVVDHASRLGKRAIRCQDGPGFIVNRMLSPYLNQALLLLCRGATERQIERAALAYGMPMSPLELIDWIGAPTMYHAGKAFTSAFPQRIDPSPMVPALLKRKRLGRAAGGGLFDYQRGQRSRQLSDQTQQLIETYRTDHREFTDGEVLLLLTIPMWIEANCLLKEGVADSMGTVDLAMAGGLGFTSDANWSEFFSELGSEQIDGAISRWQAEFKSMRKPSIK